ncbi:hypothetical protein SAMN06265348_109164 [Pedobacter westerhofensis]|uniref:Uncharacterized protein n=1 Tax=Pedobacter westerhofensis TaxID=425512 RepID=A0A521EUX0_9SPHI|nr:hypothetical protein [Pedobacter westerhofensis]SMO87717.1 hypothetical protein SAMN06265348_109164 [Pedobacter westerhofensis]
MTHTFHIPVLGLGYSIDTPLKVARYGISSVVSITDDELCERMRKFHCAENQLEYVAIAKEDEDGRARRITAYLNLLHRLVNEQFRLLRLQSFAPGNDIHNYFELLPQHSRPKMIYRHMMQMEKGEEKDVLQKELRWQMTAGGIDVNIMSKVDKANYNAAHENLGNDFTDAVAAMRGFANSTLYSSVVISAGLNPRLYAYMETCKDFFPDKAGLIRKKIILKVSDFRSALIQAKMLAKKGLWVNEFRVESGLNCGGHAFATEGFLLGPILEEFKQKRTELSNELYGIYHSALQAKDIRVSTKPGLKITAQGGIGTAEEHSFLINYYQLDAAGWGSPFLLVPEVTNVDNNTLAALAGATSEDYYISNSSPLGVLFNNFKQSTMEEQRLQRIEKGRPGSPCKKKLLSTNTEFTALPICTASREYQHLKIKELMLTETEPDVLKEKLDAVTEKICLCEGLCASTYLKNGMLKPRENKAVSICPGPNLAYFSKTYTLREMVNHIYGKEAISFKISRPNLFINELNLYVEYLKKDLNAQLDDLNTKKQKYFENFTTQLQNGINYYKNMIPELKLSTALAAQELQQQLQNAEEKLRVIAGQLNAKLS